LGFGTRVGVGSDDVNVTALFIRVALDVGIPISEDENDDKRGVRIRAPGEYECELGIKRDGGGGCL
jgi:hypothetical protein